MNVMRVTTTLLMACVVGIAAAAPGVAATNCPAYVLTAPRVKGPVQGIALDISASVADKRIATLYEIAAFDAIERAIAGHEAIVVVAFDASRSSARLVYASDAPTPAGSSILDRAAGNLARCQARRAVSSILARSAKRRATGTDVAGGVAALLDYLAPARTSGEARALVLTDGLTAPARAGGGAGFPDVGKLLDRGVSPMQLIRRYPATFRIGDARGFDIVIHGIDRGRVASASSTVRANALTRLWTLACSAAKARSCDVSAVLP